MAGVSFVELHERVGVQLLPDELRQEAVFHFGLHAPLPVTALAYVARLDFVDEAEVVIGVLRGDKSIIIPL